MKGIFWGVAGPKSSGAWNHQIPLCSRWFARHLYSGNTRCSFDPIQCSFLPPEDVQRSSIETIPPSVQFPGPPYLSNWHNRSKIWLTTQESMLVQKQRSHKPRWAPRWIPTVVDLNAIKDRCLASEPENLRPNTPSWCSVNYSLCKVGSKYFGKSMCYHGPRPRTMQW